MGEALAVVAAAAGGGVVLRSLGRRREPHPELSPDGRRYLAMAAGRPAPFPFALRWLLPALCSTSLRRWRWCTALHLGALPPLVAYWLWAEGTAAVVCVAGGLMVCGLFGGAIGWSDGGWRPHSPGVVCGWPGVVPYWRVAAPDWPGGSSNWPGAVPVWPGAVPAAPEWPG